MANFLYVDNSNVWIEGMHVSAVVKGMAPDLWTAQSQDICDNSWRVDFGRLLEFAGGQRHEVGRAVLYGSKPPEDDSIWLAAKRKGFEVVVYDRNIRNKEKKVDTKIATDITTDSFAKMKKGDEITLVAGDTDYVPAAEGVIERGFAFHVVFWDHASGELKRTATSFTSLNQWLDHLNAKRK
jgi:uncharacterized LabA/DUF88 family protein